MGLSPDELLALSTVQAVWPGRPIVLIGASALQFHGDFALEFFSKVSSATWAANGLPSWRWDEDRAERVRNAFLRGFESTAT